MQIYERERRMGFQPPGFQVNVFLHDLKPVKAMRLEPRWRDAQRGSRC